MTDRQQNATTLKMTLNDLQYNDHMKSHDHLYGVVADYTNAIKVIILIIYKALEIENEHLINESPGPTG